MAILIILLSAFLSTASAQEAVVLEDLMPSITYFDGVSYQPAQFPGRHRTIYFALSAKQYPESVIKLVLHREASVFVNGKFASNINEGGEYVFAIDSLAAVFGTANLQFALHANTGVPLVSAQVISFNQTLPQSHDPVLRQSGFFHDFSILAACILAVWFVVLWRYNARGLVIYFNFVKLFSLAERDDSLSLSKTVTSFNVVVFLFFSFLSAFFIMIAQYHMIVVWPFMYFFLAGSVGAALVKWLALSLIVFAIFSLKLFFIIVFSSMFSLRDIAGIQFANFIRTIALILVLGAFLLGIYLLTGTTNAQWYSLLVNMAIMILILWMPLILLKLMNKGSYRSFHLFSYLCPSEFLPVLLLIKALIL